ncbi:unnamed protein product [Caenorhabditis brenneri]
MFWTPALHWEAEQNCTALSGTLVTIKSAIDNRAIFNLVSSEEVDYIWLGLSCFGNSTSTCYWDDGTSLSFANFQSSNQFRTRCVAMNVSNRPGSWQGIWASGYCNNDNNPATPNKFPYLCEVPPSIPAINGCEHNFSMLGD